MWRRLGDSTGSQRSGEVPLGAKCCLMASSCCTSAQTIRAKLRRTSVLNTQALCTAAATLSIKQVLACHGLSPAVAITSEDMGPHMFGVHVQARASESTFVCVYGKVGLTPRLFLAQYTVLCCSVPGTVAGSSAATERRDSSGSAPWPRGPPAPTSVGETYKIPERQLGEAICKKKKRHFLDGCHVHPPLSLSGD